MARGFGTIRETASGGFRAYYKRGGVTHTPGHTFLTRKEADYWLLEEKMLISRDQWTPPASRRARLDAEQITFGDYSSKWIASRTTKNGRPLSSKTVMEYERYRDNRLAVFKDLALHEITPEMVDQWWQDNADAPTMRHHAYSFMASVFNTAVSRELVDKSPCRVANASAKPARKSRFTKEQILNRLSPDQVAFLADAVPERWRMLVLIVAWCGLRPGEAFALSRGSLSYSERNGLPCVQLDVTKAVTDALDADKRPIRVLQDYPKTDGSVRTVWLPPHLANSFKTHVQKYALADPNGLIFPSGDMANPYGTLQAVRGYRDGRPNGFYAAARSLDLADLDFYWLRAWAAKTWKLAGMGELTADLLLGHNIGAVRAAYHVVSIETVWPALVECSRMAGWSGGISSGNSDMDLDTRILASLPTDKLREVLADLDGDRLKFALNELPCDVLAELIGNLGSPK